MNTDSFFTQGSAHAVCQDYAVHTNDYIVLSDGCSSAKDSDFGARLLTRAAICTINAKYTIQDAGFQNSILSNAMFYCESLDLPIDCLYATLLVAKCEEEYIRGLVIGDGVVVAKYKNGELEINQYEYLLNAPFYLRYYASPKDIEEYESVVGKTFVRHRTVIMPDGRVLNDHNTYSIFFDKAFFYERSQVEYVAIMSDGVCQFTQTQTDTVSKQSCVIDYLDVIKELTAFKGFQGDFVQRRCKMALKKWALQGTRPADDLSVGVIYNG